MFMRGSPIYSLTFMGQVRAAERQQKSGNTSLIGNIFRLPERLRIPALLRPLDTPPVLKKR